MQLKKDIFTPLEVERWLEARTWVARWFAFEPKIPIWVNFGESCDGRCWHIL
jgi:hypothetical protein